MNTAYILGAGFSYAVAGLPLLNKLGSIVEDSMRASTQGPPAFGFEVFGGNIELWMSFAAFDQPWLAADENLRNRSDALRATRYIAESIFQREIVYRDEHGDIHAPENALIAELAMHWLRDNSTIISFNYDTLVESALLEMGYKKSVADMYVLPTVGHDGRQTTGRNFNTFYDYDAFNLAIMKLHGSVNWKYTGPSGSPSDPVYLLRQPHGWGTSLDAISYRPLERPYLTDLIVPPTSVKDAYYSNIALAHQWRLARRAIGRHDEIVLIGFSLPETDVAVRNLIASSWGPGSGARFTVVDVSAAPVDSLRRILPESAAIDERFAGRPDALSAYVASLSETA